MVTNRILRYQNKEMNLSELAQNISQFLQSDNFRVQSRDIPSGFIIQARKGGILNDLIDAERALTIVIEGDSNDFTIKVGIAKFIQNLAVMAAETILLSALFLVVDVPEMLWTEHIEKGVIKNIQGMIP
ncbi:MAG: hypothetical protein M1515_04095 [Candidatus Thermoplasmatota archaeon]|jgi:hypothetical protein|nr:hypothetical protein [Candidatus Thermoplasmatota archaeon]